MKSKLIILGEAILSLIIFKDIFFEKIKKKKWRKKDAGQIEIRIMENKDGWGFFFFGFPSKPTKFILQIKGKEEEK